MKTQNIIFHSILICIALAGGCTLVASTMQGMGLGGDATIYLTTARNFLAGNGMGLIGPKGEFKVIPYAPPFFPILLSVFGIFHFDMVIADRWLNIFFFLVMILLIGKSLYWVTHSKWAGWITAGLFAISPVMIPVFSWVMTEPPLIFFGFSGLALLGYYELKSKRWWIFVLSAISVGLAFVTHYKALPFLMTGVLGILLFSQGKWTKRFTKTFIYGLVGSIPMIAWLIYSISMTSGLASRSLVSLSEMGNLFIKLMGLLKQVFLFWLIPDSWITDPAYPVFLNYVLLFGGIFILLVWLGWSLLRMMSSDRQDTTGYQFSVGLLSAFIFSYILMITTTYLTIYPQITVNNRMLSPVFTAVIWMVGLLAAYSLRGVKLNRLIQVGIGCVVIILIGWYGIRCVKIVQTNQEVGMGYQEVIWKQSEILQAVKNLPESALIVTNEELLILYWLDRPSYPFAETYFKDPVNKFYRYGDGDLTTDSAQRCFREEGAYFVLFNTIENEFRSMYGDKAEERLAVLTDGLIKIYSGSDGAIYLYP